MKGPRYQALQEAVRDYGAAAFENMCLCRKFGEGVIAGLPGWLGCPSHYVAGVPADGPFDPRRDYGEAMFSFHDREIVVMEPVRFGVSVIIDNLDAPGGVWARASVSVQVTGDTFDVFIGGRPMLHAPRAFEDALEPVFEGLEEELHAAFREGVETFRDDRGDARIGFLLE